MLKAILFDLDNTLLDFSGFKRESALAVAKAIREAGVRESEKALYEKLFAIYEKKGIEYQNTFEDLLSDYNLGASLHEHAKQAAIIAYTKKKYLLLKPRPKVVTMLSALRKKYKLAVVTDAPREKAWQRLILAGLDHLFGVVVSYDDSGEKKPSKLPFMNALRVLNVLPQEALFVGDMPERDIVGAKRAGLATCFAKYGCIAYSPEENVADFTIEKFDEIKGIIEQLEG